MRQIIKQGKLSDERYQAEVPWYQREWVTEDEYDEILDDFSDTSDIAPRQFVWWRSLKHDRKNWNNGKYYFKTNT